jgi:hypothetical protein
MLSKKSAIRFLDHGGTYLLLEPARARWKSATPRPSWPWRSGGTGRGGGRRAAGGDRAVAQRGGFRLALFSRVGDGGNGRFFGAATGARAQRRRPMGRSDSRKRRNVSCRATWRPWPIAQEQVRTHGCLAGGEEASSSARRLRRFRGAEDGDEGDADRRPPGWQTRRPSRHARRNRSFGADQWLRMPTAMCVWRGLPAADDPTKHSAAAALPPRTRIAQPRTFADASAMSKTPPTW